MSSKALALLFLPVCSMLAQRIQPSDLWKRPVAVADHKLAYGQDALQFGELRLPKTKGLSPVVVLVHGGCWMDGLPGRDPRDTSFEALRPLAAALADVGVATWNVEYRRVGNPGGGWPGSFLDLAAAVDFLRSIASTHRLDLKRIVIVGHSAGGQLAQWMAARQKLGRASGVYVKNPLPVKGVVNVDGPPDLTTAQPLERNFCPVPGITSFMGGTPAAHPERYRDGSATALLPTGVPQTIVVGGLLLRSYDLVGAYKAAATAKGEAVDVLRLEGSGHFDMLAPESQFGKRLLEAILALLQ